MRPFAVFALLLALSRLSLAQDTGTLVKVGSLQAMTPADWKREKPANLLRSYQFRLPEVNDLPGCEVAVFPDSHPNPDKSIPKWKNQFIPPEGKTIDDISRTTKWDVKGATVTVFEIVGATWRYKAAPNDPKSPEMLLDNYHVVWVIVAEPEQATHIRMSGLAPVMKAHLPAFEKWVKSLR